jgi:hypothetical protein
VDNNLLAGKWSEVLHVEVLEVFLVVIVCVDRQFQARLYQLRDNIPLRQAENFTE